MSERSDRRSELVDLWLIGLLSLAFGAFFVGGLIRATREEPERVAGALRLAGTTVDVDVERATGHLTLRNHDGSPLLEADLALWIDGEVRQIALRSTQIDLVGRRTVEAHFPLVLPSGRTHAVLRLTLQTGATDVLVASLAVSGRAGTTAGADGATVAPTLAFSASGKRIFVSGVGEVDDLGTVAGTALTFEHEGRAIGLVSSRGSLSVDVAGEIDHELHVQVVPPSSDVTLQPTATDLALVVTAPGAASDVWGAVYGFAGARTGLVRGFVTGTTPHQSSTVYGMGEESASDVRVTTGADGRFSFQAPRSVSHWYAALDPSRTSPAVDYRPGAGFDLKLDVSPGGELLVRVEDGDTHEPLTARLIVHGVDGTLDPSFGPDYRASGAGPIIDALHGAITTPLPTGRYRVSATKGIEWSIDAKTLDIASGRSESVDLSIRHVVPTPGVVSCDLHVHARPSFDSPVLVEDRVLSLVSAGIDFAVPSEHNIVGDYGAALEALDLTHQLASVTGVEITTFQPRFGHFGLFPYPTSGKIPPYRATTVNAVFDFAHKSAPGAVLQVNHPRLTKGIGYFDVFHFDPKRPPPFGMRTDFDTLEVYNGYESRTPEAVEVVLRDWFALLDQGHRYAATGSSDSHRIQYQWAGYPRTMAVVGDAAGGDHGDPIDTSAVVNALRKGHSFVTSGPILEFELEGAHPGDELASEATLLHGHLRVRAAPWVDVTSVEIVAGGKSAETIEIPSRPLALGPELGERAEVEARTIRYDADVSVPVPSTPNPYVVVVARGTRPMDDVLPFMPVPPRAFTNPIYIVRAKSTSAAPETTPSP